MFFPKFPGYYQKEVDGFVARFLAWCEILSGDINRENLERARIPCPETRGCVCSEQKDLTMRADAAAIARDHIFNSMKNMATVFDLSLHNGKGGWVRTEVLSIADRVWSVFVLRRYENGEDRDPIYYFWNGAAWEQVDASAARHIFDMSFFYPKLKVV